MANILKSLNITVMGGGSWGTALARLLAKKGLNVRIWAYEGEVADGINTAHRNPLYLSEIELPKSLHATSNYKEALLDAEIIVSTVPSHALRTVMKDAGAFIKDSSIIVSCTKGIEVTTGKLVSEILGETLPNIRQEQMTYLSGPSFAIDVANDLPTTVVIAGTERKYARIVQETFRTDTFLTFTHNDVIGVEVGGAIKNIIAIASGVSDGLGFGANSRAALITRGLYEMIKIGKAMGANPFTFTGLSGMGDLILTCTSTTSRNYTFGYQIGRGKKVKDILEKMTMVAEGVKTTMAIHELTKKHDVFAPICGEMYKIIYEGKSARQAAFELTNMELSDELRSIVTV